MAKVLQNYILISKVQPSVHTKSNFQKEQRGIKC